MFEKIIHDFALYKYLLNMLGISESQKPGELHGQIANAKNCGYIVGLNGVDIQRAAGFLPTRKELTLGTQILTHFVCIRDGEVWVTDRTPKASFAPLVGELEGFAPPQPAALEQEQLLKKTATDAEVSKAARQLLHDYSAKRVTDLLPKASAFESKSIYKSCECDPLKVLKELGGAITGYVIATNEQLLSRSFMLLHRGRSLGCVHKSMHTDVGPFIAMAERLLEDLVEPDTIFSIHDVPMHLILPTASLCLGWPVTADNKADPTEYFNYHRNWIEEKKLTACFTLIGKRAFTTETNLVYFYEGEFRGASHIEGKEFIEEIGIVQEFLKSEPRVDVEVSYLSREIETIGESLDILIAKL